MKKTMIIISAITVILLCILWSIFSKEELPKIDYVDGSQHIYKGQKLDSSRDFKIQSLSPRASYLNSSQYIDASIKEPLEQMILDAEKEGMCLVVISGYRTPEQQQLLYNSEQDKTKVALPNESEHQTGLAVDFTACPMKEGVRNDDIQRLELEKPFKELPEYCWLVRNAWKYSFEQSFTEYNKDITGYSAEPWHWKYIVK